MRRLISFSVFVGSACMAVFIVALRFVMGLFNPSAPRIIVAGPSLVLSTSGVSLDPAMLTSLRHEAGVPRRSSARHT